MENLSDVDDTPLAQAALCAPAMRRSGPSGGAPRAQQGDQPGQPGHPFRAEQGSGSGGVGWTANGSGSGDDGASADSAAGAAPTELIFRLERRGQGWAEEIFPHLVVENRPINKPSRDRPRSTQPDPWQASCRSAVFVNLGSLSLRAAPEYIASICSDSQESAYSFSLLPRPACCSLLKRLS